MAYRINIINLQRLLTTRMATSVCLHKRNIAFLPCLQTRDAQNNNQLLAARFQIEHFQKRYKKRVKGGPGKKAIDDDEERGSDDDDDDDDTPDEDPEVVEKGYFDSTVNVNSLRVDTVLKTASKVSRAKIEEAFYDSRIRINNERVTKKSVDVAQDDVVDIILGRNMENHDFLDVSRIEIKEIPDLATSRSRLNLKVRKYSNLTIENYEDPYDGTLLNQKNKK